MNTKIVNNVIESTVNESDSDIFDKTSHYFKVNATLFEKVNILICENTDMSDEVDSDMLKRTQYLETYTKIISWCMNANDDDFEYILLLLLEGYEKEEDMTKKINGTLKEKEINLTVIQNTEQQNIQKQESNQEVKIDINLKISIFHEIQSDFDDFKNLLIELNQEFEKNLDKIGDSQDEVRADIDNNKLIKLHNKVGTFLRKVRDEKPKFYKIVHMGKKVFEFTQKLDKVCNKIIQWIAPFVVSDLFLGK